MSDYRLSHALTVIMRRSEALTVEKFYGTLPMSAVGAVFSQLAGKPSAHTITASLPGSESTAFIRYFAALSLVF